MKDDSTLMDDHDATDDPFTFEGSHVEFVEEQKPWPSMYPFKGIAYFASNRELWTTVAVPLAVTGVSSVAIAIVMVLFTLEPQAHLLERVLPDMASWPIAIVLVAAETLTALFIVIQLLFVHYKARLFNKVFEIEGVPRDTSQLTLTDEMRQCFCQQVLSFLLLLFTIPLNALPVIGTVLFLFINGFTLAWGLQDSFLVSKGMTLANQWQYMRSGSWRSYMTFGFFAIILDLLPFFNILFIYTNVVGAALWAVELERGGEVDRFMLDIVNQSLDGVGYKPVAGGIEF